MNLFESQDDLGFETVPDSDVNMFELFNSGKADLTTDDNADKTPTAKSDTPKAKASDVDEKAEPEIDTDEVKEMMLKHLTGEAADDTNEDADTAPADTKPAPAADDAEEVEPVRLVFDHLKEKGIFTVPEDFEFDGSDEKLEEAAELTVAAKLEDAVEEHIASAFSKRPEQVETVKAFVAFMGNGGKVEDFVTAYSGPGVKAEDLDADDESVRMAAAKQTLSAYYKDVMKWPAEKIKRQIDRSESKGDIMIDEAKDVLEEYNAYKQEQRKTMLDAAATREKAQKQASLDFNKQLLEAVNTETEVAGFKIKDKKEREALKDYMFKPTVELNGKMVPQYLADRNSLQTDPKKLLAQALMLKNGMKPDTAAVVTKVTSSLASKLSNMQKGRKASSGSGQGTENKDRSTPGILDLDNLEAVYM